MADDGRSRDEGGGTWREEGARLRRRCAKLERELAENRQLNRRIAELADIMAEVLLPAQDRDDARLRVALAEYDRSLHGNR